MVLRLSKFVYIPILAGILLLAMILRLTGVDWDEYHHYHPDERYIAWVATSIEMPKDWGSAFHPHETSLNPYYWPAGAESAGIVVPHDEPRAFAYGHLPLYLGVGATHLAKVMGAKWGDSLPASWTLAQDVFNQNGYIEFNHLTIVGRVVTAWVDVGTVFLLFLLGQRLYGTATGLLAATFLALNVMHIQLAHFFATDPYVAFFAVLAIMGMVWRKHALAGIAIGLAIGSKFAGIFLFIPLALACWQQYPTYQKWLAKMLGYGGLALVAFGLTNPFALLDFTCEVISPETRIAGITIPALDWRSCFVENVAKQSGIVSGQADIGFARQYTDTLPYLYPIEMQIKWGMGISLGIVAFAGIAWLMMRILKQSREQQDIVQKEELILLVWIVAFILLTGGSFVKFMRYWQPVTPFLMLVGAAWLGRLPQLWKRITVSLVLVSTLFYALAFVNMYQQRHPWLEASEWIYSNVPPHSSIMTEQWDDLLPTSMEIDGTYYSRGQYQQEELTWLTYPDEKDTLDRLENNLIGVAQADYLVIASNRVYGVVPRLAERYSLSSQYYELLFAGTLGFEVVHVSGRQPNLAGIAITPDPFAWIDLPAPSPVDSYLDQHTTFTWGRADESFTVYDQALVFIMKNQAQYTPNELLAFFDVEETRFGEPTYIVPVPTKDFSLSIP